MDLNDHYLSGRLGADPQVIDTQSGFPIVVLRIASKSYRSDKSTGGKQEHTAWNRVVVKGQAAEYARDNVRKGDAVRVRGTVETRSYERDGQTLYVTETITWNLTLEGKSRGGGNSNQSAARPEPHPAAPPSGEETGHDQGPPSQGDASGPARFDDQDSDIPF